MSYSTPQMVRKALMPTPDGSQPSPQAHNAADLSDTELSDAILEADSMIDSYLSAVYVTPVALNNDGTAPVPLGFWSRTIAAYLATAAYRGSMPMEDADPLVRRYKDVLALLNNVALGKVKIDLPSASDTGSGPSGAGSPFNPYVGELWTPDDFDVNAPNLPDWRWR